MKSPVTIICKKHGRKQITPNSLIYGKCGCDECGRERSEAAKMRPLEDVLKQATQVHEGKYGYHKIENYTDIEEEIADVFIVLVSICNRLNINLYDAIKKKEEKNIKRQWKVNKVEKK